MDARRTCQGSWCWPLIMLFWLSDRSWRSDRSSLHPRNWELKHQPPRTVRGLKEHQIAVCVLVLRNGKWPGKVMYALATPRIKENVIFCIMNTTLHSTTFDGTWLPVSSLQNRKNNRAPPLPNAESCLHVSWLPRHTLLWYVDVLAGNTFTLHHLKPFDVIQRMETLATSFDWAELSRCRWPGGLLRLNYAKGWWCWKGHIAPLTTTSVTTAATSLLPPSPQPSNMIIWQRFV